ncbi:MAG: SCO family protein [Verrucomicrobia bacterium]|nr:SCO family protein [Verrucomicrobiota bacterium]
MIQARWLGRALVVLHLCLPSRAVVAAAGGPAATGVQDPGAALMRRQFAESMPDPVLINQRGERLRFFTDLVKGRAVVINFFYADCDRSCPLANGTIRSLRSEFTESFGRSVRFLSITLKAGTDTPEVIARYAKQHAVESAHPDVPDWHFLTGNPDEIRALRWHLGMREKDPAVDGDPAQHAAMLVVGNHATGRWAKLNPLVRPSLVREKAQRIIGWTAAQRYADIRAQVAASAGRRAEPDPAPPVLPPEEPEEAPLPILGRLETPLSGVERGGTPVSTSPLRGKVTVYGRIYTLCPHGSQAVLAAMKRLKDAFGETGEFHLVALSPESTRDTPAFFQSFATLAGAVAEDPWWFVISGKEAVDRFTRSGLGLDPPRPIPAEERLHPDEEEEYDLRLVLVDQQGCIRGRYEVFHPDPFLSQDAAWQIGADTAKLLSQPLPDPNRP